jgi:Family of unknown function (DUF6186)
MTSHDLTIVAYLGLTSLFVVLELLARFTPFGVPTLGSVIIRMLRYRAGQVAVLFAWWWLGWHFLAS